MSGAPSAPSFNQIGYVSPQPLAQAQSATGNIPAAMTGPQLAGQANQTMAAGPSWLNLNNYNGTSNPSSPGGQGGPFDQNLINQMSNWYMQNQVNPQVSQILAQNQTQGGGYGSNGAAQAGQFGAEGQQQAFQAALAANQQEFNDVLGGNQSYYSQPVALAQGQNALGISSALQQAGLNNQSNIANMEGANQYNLASAGMANNFNLNPLQNPNALAQNKYNDEFQNTQYNNSLIGSAIGAGTLGLGAGIGGSSGLGGGLASLGKGLLTSF